MHALSRRVALALGAVVVLSSLSACGDPSAPAGTLPTVSGKFGATPTITFPSSGPPSTLRDKTLEAGHGPVVRKGQLLVANYVGQIWNGKVFDSSFTRRVASAFPIGVGKVIPGWDKTLVGAHAGSRLLLVIPPAEGYGPKGQPNAGIKGTDTLVFVVDILRSYSTSAIGAPNSPTLHANVGGITVTWARSTPPAVHVPAGTTPPKTSQLTVLSRGTGPHIVPGLLVLQYVVVDAKTGHVDYSTWTNGLPDGATAGVPAQPTVLDKFVGLPLGSRVLLRVPKSSTAGPLVFAVDVVAQPSVLG